MAKANFARERLVSRRREHAGRKNAMTFALRRNKTCKIFFAKVDAQFVFVEHCSVVADGKVAKRCTYWFTESDSVILIQLAMIQLAMIDDRQCLTQIKTKIIFIKTHHHLWSAWIRERNSMNFIGQFTRIGLRLQKESTTLVFLWMLQNVDFIYCPRIGIHREIPGDRPNRRSVVRLASVYHFYRLLYIAASFAFSWKVSVHLQCAYSAACANCQPHSASPDVVLGCLTSRSSSENVCFTVGRRIRQWKQANHSTVWETTSLHLRLVSSLV